MENSKLAVGQWVICIEKPSNGGGAGWKEGKVFQIDRISNPSPHYVAWESGSPYGVYANALRLATEEEILAGHVIKPNEYDIY